MSRRRTKDDIVHQEMMGDHLIPFYRITTSDGVVADVPKHIRRIVSISKRTGRVDARGWQIAFKRNDHGTYNPFFPDGEEGPWISLDRATNALRRYLEKTPNTKQSGLKHKEFKRNIYKTGMPGIRIEWRFGRRNALYDLKIEARAGAYNPNKAIQFYVGTEFSIDEFKLRKALNESLKFRREHIAYAEANGQTFPKRAKTPKLDVDIHKVFNVLEYHKKQHSERLKKIALEKAEKWMSEKRLYRTFRNHRFYAERQIIEGQIVKVPDFLEVDDGEWICNYPLPDGSSYHSEIPITNNPEQDVIELISECFYESMMTNIPVPVDTLFSERRA